LPGQTRPRWRAHLVTLLLTLPLLSPHRALAQSTLERPRDPRSVYRVSLAIDLPLSAAAGLAVLLPYALSEPLIDERCPCDPAEINAFDRRAVGNRSLAAAWASDVTVGVSLLTPLVLDALALRAGRALFEDLLVFVEAIAINGALVTGAKYISQRPLPRTYEGQASLIESPGGYRSFYSGHTSIVFTALTATAMTARLRYGERYWPWLVALGVGTSVAVERVADGRHFASDVIIGAAAGTLVGVLVPWLHARVPERQGALVVSPVRAGVLLGWRTHR
jgi:membrane-associated phospholipid phosphatase